MSALTWFFGTLIAASLLHWANFELLEQDIMWLEVSVLVGGLTCGMLAMF